MTCLVRRASVLRLSNINEIFPFKKKKYNEQKTKLLLLVLLLLLLFMLLDAAILISNLNLSLWPFGRESRREGGESHTTYAYKYISECIFLNFESVLNYTRTLAHTQRRCTLPLPLPRPRLCWRVETRISSMFNPKHKTEKPNRQKHNQIEPKTEAGLNATRCSSSPLTLLPLLLHLLHLRHNLVLVLVLALGRGLKYFTGNLRKRNPSNNMFYTFL